VLQAEFSLNQVPDKPVTGRIFFERSSGTTWTSARPDKAGLLIEAVADLLDRAASSTAANALSGGLNPIPDRAAMQFTYSFPLQHSFALYGK
jgi:hypothetical protein